VNSKAPESLRKITVRKKGWRGWAGLRCPVANKLEVKDSWKNTLEK